MSEEREITVRIFTERQGVDMPLVGFFGQMLNESFAAVGEEPPEEEPEEDVPEEEEDDLPEEEPERGEAFPPSGATASDEDAAPEKSEFFAVGKLVETDDRLEIVYEESVLTGMEGSVTSVGFSKTEPQIVTMVREGFVNTALVFEKGKRHISVYQTPFARFELSVCALKVQNLLLREGLIELDYVTELHGARTERCKMKIIIG